MSEKHFSWADALAFIVGFFIGTTLYYSCARASTPGQMFAITIEAEEFGRVYGIDPALILAVIDVESSFNPTKRGGHGEIGLMQLRQNFIPDASYEIRKNIELGTAALSFARANCPSKEDLTWVSCFNSGIHRHPKYPKLLPYYKKIMTAYRKYSRQTAEVQNQ